MLWNHLVKPTLQQQIRRNPYRHGERSYYDQLTKMGWMPLSSRENVKELIRKNGITDETLELIYPYFALNLVSGAKALIMQDLADRQRKVELCLRLPQGCLAGRLPMMPWFVRHHLKEFNKLHYRIIASLDRDITGPFTRSLLDVSNHGADSRTGIIRAYQGMKQVLDRFSG